MGNRPAMLPTLSSPPARAARMARRVGSAMAAYTRFNWGRCARGAACEECRRGILSFNRSVEYYRVGEDCATIKERGSRTMTQNGASVLTHHPVVSHEEWLAARTAFLAPEKEVTRLRGQLSEEGRRPPGGAVPKDYLFEGPSGKPAPGEPFAG